MSVRRTAAALLGTAVLLAGCSGDPEPRFTPTESPSPSESRTTTKPAAQTPEEFIEEWFEVGTNMQNSGETEAFLALSDGCDPCAQFAEDVAGVYAAGGFIRISSERVVSIKATTARQFEVRVLSSQTTFRETADSKLDSFPGGLNTFVITLNKRADSWAIADYLDKA